MVATGPSARMMAALLLLAACDRSASTGTPPPAPANDASGARGRVDAVADLGARDADSPELGLPDARVDGAAEVSRPELGPPDMPAGDAPGDAAGQVALRLESATFYSRGGDLIFPASACYPMDVSPAFTFLGVPAGARSLAFTFVDRSNGATKWVVWDIPPGTPGLPANLSKTAHPRELPTASQRGSLGRTGYSGPGVAGPPLHTYDFRLYALDVDKLPGTDGASTVTIRTTLIPQHLLAQSPIFTAKGQLGGSGQ